MMYNIFQLLIFGALPYLVLTFVGPGQAVHEEKAAIQERPVVDCQTQVDIYDISL